MMATTHAAAGVCLVSPLVFLAPELAVPAALGAILGGVLPDVDLFVGRHRRTLHYPVLGWLPALVTIGGATLVPTPASAALAGFFVAFAFHALSDVVGAGEEERPWEATSERAVYDHPRGRWWRPRRLIPYDGSPQDLIAVAVLSVPGLVLFDGAVRWLLLGGLVVSLGYTSFRKRMPAWMR
jgi:hypothetical protein